MCAVVKNDVFSILFTRAKGCWPPKSSVVGEWFFPSPRFYCHAKNFVSYPKNHFHPLLGTFSDFPLGKFFYLILRKQTSPKIGNIEFHFKSHLKSRKQRKKFLNFFVLPILKNLKVLILFLNDKKAGEFFLSLLLLLTVFDVLT